MISSIYVYSHLHELKILNSREDFMRHCVEESHIHTEVRTLALLMSEHS